MKKSLILLAFLSSAVLQQSMAQENVSIGPIFGTSISNLRGDISNNHWKAGLTVGGFYNYSSRSGFGFSGQLLYTQMGAKVNNKTDEINLNYLQVPLFATFFFGQRGNELRPKLFLGPTANFLLSARNEDSESIRGDRNNRQFNPFDLGITGGAGLNYLINDKVWLNFDVRYGIGLLDVSKNPSVFLANNNWGINMGVSFPFGTYNKRSKQLRTR
jgi:hypothetical protein